MSVATHGHVPNHQKKKNINKKFDGIGGRPTEGPSQPIAPRVGAICTLLSSLPIRLPCAESAPSASIERAGDGGPSQPQQEEPGQRIGKG
jgi:hypothetical protein